MRFLNRYREPSDDENPYWISFSDLMAGLLIIFILAAIALIMELAQKSEQWDEVIKEIAKAESVREEMIREIQDELAAREIRVLVDDSSTVISIPEDQLSFESASFQIPATPRSQQIVDEIGLVLKQSLTVERTKFLDTIFVEGHTDAKPYYNQRIKGNWGLSTFRAISVWEHWNQEGQSLKLDDLLNHEGKNLFSVSGYASTRPDPSTLEDVFSEESMRRNRRIDLRFTVRRPPLSEYEAIREALQ